VRQHLWGAGLRESDRPRRPTRGRQPRAPWCHSPAWSRRDRWTERRSACGRRLPPAVRGRRLGGGNPSRV